MFLERIEVKGFRGINRLSLGLDNTTVLIGENAWGKSSLLRALWCLLGMPSPINLVRMIFIGRKIPSSNPRARCNWCSPSASIVPRCASTPAVWPASGRPGSHKDKFHRVHYRASAELQDDGSVLTTHDFLDGIGKSLTIDNNEALVRLLITMNPVFRLRDARTARDGIERLPWGSV